MHVVVFLDLDDTIFQTQGKCPTGETLHVAAVDRQGKPLSFMSETQWGFLNWLSQGATVIPTTARNLDAFRRVRLNFHHAAILSFGAVILDPDGKPDLEWDAAIRPRLSQMSEELHSIGQQAFEKASQHESTLRVRLVHDFEMPVYLVAKDSDGDGARLTFLYESWQPFVDTGRFFIHRNDNNLSLVPSFLGKERAVAYVLSKYFRGAPVVTLGIGDSLTDVPFLAQCQFVAMPRRSQLFQALFPEQHRCSAEATPPRT